LLGRSIGDVRAAWLVQESVPSYASGSTVSKQAIIFVPVVELGLVAACLSAGSDLERRSHFWLRMFLVCLSLPAVLMLIVAANRLNVLSEHAALVLATVAVFAALLAMPALLCRTPESSPGPSDDEGGGGPAPDRPPASPESPRRGVPLPDADPSRIRLRDHDSPKIRSVKRRRAREPEREPVPAPPDQ
jgi:hypothetical protein